MAICKTFALFCLALTTVYSLHIDSLSYDTFNDLKNNNKGKVWIFIDQLSMFCLPTIKKKHLCFQSQNISHAHAATNKSPEEHGLV